MLIALTASPSLSCESQAAALFSCTTDLEDKGFIQFCSNGDAFADPVNNAQLEIHAADGSVTSFPADHPAGPGDFSFAHSDGKDGYLVTVRFSAGADTYYLYSLAIPPSGEDGDAGGGEAGVGRVLPDGSVEPVATCKERPFIYIATMRENFACDTSTPFGAVGCSERGADRVAPLPASPAAPIPVAP